MSLNKYNPTTGELEKIAGLVDDTDLKSRLTAAEGDIDDIEAVIPSGASASNQLITASQGADKYMSNLGWTAYAGSTLGDSVVLAMNTLDALKAGATNAYVNEYAFRGTWTGIGYWRAQLSQPRTPTNQKWQVLVQYERANGTASDSTDGVYIITVKFDNTQSAGSKYSLLSQTKLIAQSDLTTSVTSGSSAPITSGGVYNALSNKATVISGSGSITLPAGIYILSVSGFYYQSGAYEIRIVVCTGSGISTAETLHANAAAAQVPLNISYSGNIVSSVTNSHNNAMRAVLIGAYA